jgi:hypothetical protein
MTTSMNTPLREGGVRTHEVCTAIGGQLRADYSLILAVPLPRELKDRVAQLVALEFGRRGPTARPA